MKNDFVFWIIVGVGTGASAGMNYNNLPAGICFGLAMGIIVNVISRIKLRYTDNK